MSPSGLVFLLVLGFCYVSMVAGDYSGDGTHYEIDTTSACGYTNNNDQLVAAVSQAVYGTDPNSYASPVCGKCAVVTYGTKTVKVTIVDKCMACLADDIDLSPAAFQQLANLDLGRIKVTWVFTAC